MTRTYTCDKNYAGKNNIKIKINDFRDAYLTDFGRATLTDRYLTPGESYQDLFARVACYYGDDSRHAQRLYDYMSRLWFMPATPVLSNGGTSRGLSISCYLNSATDDLQGIIDLWTENVWLASNGGGIGSSFSNLRSIGEPVRGTGKTSGIMPFIKVMDSMTMGINQGLLRRGSAAVYLHDSHPEIEEFIDMRKPTGGDPNRRCLNLHHGVMISDDFMKAVESDSEWEFKSPKDNSVIRKVKARDLWIRLLTSRIETGEPYLCFSDTIDRARPDVYKKLGLKVKQSNLCSEIMLTTGKDHLNNERTAVCCLSSLNIEYYEDWRDDTKFILDIMTFLDNVLQDFINKAPDTMARAKYSAIRERSVGLGVMGLHSFFQSNNIPFEGDRAEAWNRIIFNHIYGCAHKASIILAGKRGSCPDVEEIKGKDRFSHKMAIAPTASISVIAGNASPGIEPIVANVFTQKTLSGSFTVRNRHLQGLLDAIGKDTDDVWRSIIHNEGSVQHLDFLTDLQKAVFKTAFEIDNMRIVALAADRAPYIDQAQSVNLFLRGNISKRDLHRIHFKAWKSGVKSLYYCRSMALQRAEKAPVIEDPINPSKNCNDGETCSVCQ